MECYIHIIWNSLLSQRTTKHQIVSSACSSSEVGAAVRVEKYHRQRYNKEIVPISHTLALWSMKIENPA
jgi:hypothetical protein